MNEEKFNILIILLTKVSGGPVTSNLFEAALSGNAAFVQQVVNEGIEICTQRLQDAGEPNPLDISIGNGNSFLAKYLIDNGVNVNAKDSYGNTPLMCAVSKNLTKLTGILLERGANINDQNDNGLSPLHIAISHGWVELARNLIGNGANVDCKSVDGFTPLHIVIQNSLRDQANTSTYSGTSHFISVELCKLLIGEGADLNITDNCGNTALHNAAKVGNFILTKLLLFKGAAVNMRNTNGKTPLLIAFDHKKPYVCITLIKGGASVDLSDEEGNTCFHLMFTSNFSSSFSNMLIHKLIDSGADINKKNKEGNTVLMLAIEHKSVNDIIVLLNRGADINVQNNNGDTALLLVFKCLSNYFDLWTFSFDRKEDNVITFCDVPRKLISKGATVNVQDNEGNTPLHLAYINNLEQYIDLLLDSGSNVNVKNNSGNTPVHIAMSRYDKNFLDKIMQRKIDVDINIQNNIGDTPLHKLLMPDCPTFPVPSDLLHMLIDYGARVDIRNNNGQAPFHIARLHSESQKILTKHLTKMRIAGLNIMIDSQINNEDTEIECLAEMERIKSTKINDKHSLDRLFSSNENPGYLTNSKEFIENVMVTPVLEEMFPLYASLLRIQYKLASERLRLMKLADYSLISRSKTMYLQNMPDIVKEQIFQYLENEDLQSLIKSMQPSKKKLHLKSK